MAHRYVASMILAHSKRCQEVFRVEAERIIALLKEKNLTLATAESCTGGLLAGALTAVPGSSECFGYGLVTYSNEAKQRLLGVPDEVLVSHGAVSAECAFAMALGARQLSGADIALSVTGIAGPGGATEQKPLGLVYICLTMATPGLLEKHVFTGNRDEVRAQTVAAALELILYCLEDMI